jgi:hypothetical protein
LRCLADRGENLGSNTARLLQLLDADGADALEDALVDVLERDTVHIGAVRQVLDRLRSERGLPPSISISLAPSEHRDLVVTPHSLATYDSINNDTQSWPTSILPTWNRDSPESNGMAESLVKSLKRDYVYLADLWTADDVLRLLPTWVHDYNHERPHKGLPMLSPVEFRNQQLASWTGPVQPGATPPEHALAILDVHIPLGWGDEWSMNTDVKAKLCCRRRKPTGANR